MSVIGEPVPGVKPVEAIDSASPVRGSTNTNLAEAMRLRAGDALNASTNNLQREVDQIGGRVSNEVGPAATVNIAPAAAPQAEAEVEPEVVDAQSHVIEENAVPDLKPGGGGNGPGNGEDGDEFGRRPEKPGQGGEPTLNFQFRLWTNQLKKDDFTKDDIAKGEDKFSETKITYDSAWVVARSDAWNTVDTSFEAIYHRSPTYAERHQIWLNCVTDRITGMVNDAGDKKGEVVDSLNKMAKVSKLDSQNLTKESVAGFLEEYYDNYAASGKSINNLLDNPDFTPKDAQNINAFLKGQLGGEIPYRTFYAMLYARNFGTRRQNNEFTDDDILKMPLKNWEKDSIDYMNDEHELPEYKVEEKYLEGFPMAIAGPQPPTSSESEDEDREEEAEEEPEAVQQDSGSVLADEASLQTDGSPTDKPEPVTIEGQNVKWAHRRQPAAEQTPTAVPAETDHDELISAIQAELGAPTPTPTASGEPIPIAEKRQENILAGVNELLKSKNLPEAKKLEDITKETGLERMKTITKAYFDAMGIFDRTTTQDFLRVDLLNLSPMGREMLLKNAIHGINYLRDPRNSHTKEVLNKFREVYNGIFGLAIKPEIASAKANSVKVVHGDFHFMQARFTPELYVEMLSSIETIKANIESYKVEPRLRDKYKEIIEGNTLLPDFSNAHLSYGYQQRAA